MGGICGWMNSPLDAEEGKIVLPQMMGELGGTDAGGRPAIITDAWALAVRSGVGAVDLHRAGSLVTAVDGRIHWQSTSLKALAADKGLAAALAEAYRDRGVKCLDGMRGAFAIAVIDTASRNGLLAIDRMGIRTMCYAHPPGQLTFGSTAGSVAAHPKIGRAVSRQALFDYLFFHVIPSPGTIYQGVQKLLPGECVTFCNGVTERRFYWRMPYTEHSTESFGVLKSRFQNLLRKSAQRAINGSSHIGAFLSGGTDSSTVAGLLTELRGEPANTYSIGFAAEGFDEMGYARITARHFKTRAHEYYVTPQDVVEAIPIIAQSYDEPFGNDSAVPAYFCAKMARADGIQVMLAGDGGDEIFGGNVRYAKQKVFEAYSLVPTALRRAVVEPLASLAASDAIAPLRKLKSYVSQASVPLPDRLESYNFLRRSSLTDILEPDFLADVDESQPLAMLREVYQGTASASVVNRMMHLDLKFTLADNDLRKVSRMCEAAGVEVRYPLLDDALVAFSGELPPSLKVKGLSLRYFFKQALKDFLAPETLAKTKHGFGMPFGIWLRDHKPLTELVHSSLEAFQHREIVKPSYIKDVLHSHETSHATYFGIMIWVMMMLERWLQARGL
jgi:asparagine synthase (glutamine-hydrolysing)